MRDVDRYYGGEKTIPYRKQLTPKSITARSGSIEENPQTQREGEEEVLVKEVLMTYPGHILTISSYTYSRCKNDKSSLQICAISEPERNDRGNFTEERRR